MDFLYGIPSMDNITHKDLRKSSTTHGMPKPGDDVSKPESWNKSAEVLPAKPMQTQPIQLQLRDPNNVSRPPTLSATSSEKMPREALSPLKVKALSSSPGSNRGDPQRSSAYSGIVKSPGLGPVARKPSRPPGSKPMATSSSHRAPEFSDPFVRHPMKPSTARLGITAPTPLQQSSQPSPRTETLPQLRQRAAAKGVDPDETPYRSRSEPVVSGNTESSRKLRIDSQPEVRTIPGRPIKSITGSLLTKAQSVRLVTILCAIGILLSMAGRSEGGEASGRTTLAICMISMAGYILYESYLDRKAEADFAASGPTIKNASRVAKPMKVALRMHERAEGTKETYMRAEEGVAKRGRMAAREARFRDRERRKEAESHANLHRQRIGSMEGITESTLSRDERLAEMRVQAGITSAEMDQTYRPLFFAEFRDPFAKSFPERVEDLKSKIEEASETLPDNYSEKCEAVMHCARESFVDAMINPEIGAYLIGQTIRLHLLPSSGILEICIFLWEDQRDFDPARESWYRSLEALKRILAMMAKGELPRLPPAEPKIELMFRPAATRSIPKEHRLEFNEISAQTGLSVEVIRAISEPAESMKRSRWLADLLLLCQPQRVAISYKPHRGWERTRSGKKEWKAEEWSRVVPSAFAALAKAGDEVFSKNPLEVLEIVDHLPMKWQSGENRIGKFGFSGWEYRTLLVSLSPGNSQSNAAMIQRMIHSSLGIMDRYQAPLIAASPDEDRPVLVLSAKGPESVLIVAKIVDQKLEVLGQHLTDISTQLNADTSSAGTSTSQRDLYVRRAKLKDRINGLNALKKSSSWLNETDKEDQRFRAIWKETDDFDEVG